MQLFITFYHPAQTEHDVIKLMVDAIHNIKLICEVEKIGVAISLLQHMWKTKR